MREAFEKLPEIARHIHKFVYQDDLNCYRNKIKSSDIHLVTWVNGAWYAFQEQQKRIEEFRKINISLNAGLRKNSKNKQKLLGKNIELQKRIDGALNVCDDNRLCIGKFLMEDETLGLIDEVEKALRGAND